MSSQAGIAQARTQAGWPLLSGPIPPLADAYIPRHETGPGAAGDMAPGDAVALVTAGEAGGGPGGELAGTGKTQLAVALVRALREARALDLTVWVQAASRDAVITAYAQAILEVRGPRQGEAPEAAASAFLAWLADTDRTWLVVFDDLSEPGVLAGLWPSGPRGRVLVTARRADMVTQAGGPRIVEVGAFSRQEALAYLSARLHADPGQLAGAAELANDLGFLPIALGQAGALMAETGLSCGQYLAQFRRQRRPAAGAAGAWPAIVASTWSLAAELAGGMPPTGLARPALALAAMLDPGGIPGAVLVSRAACAYLSRSLGAGPVEEAEARAAMYNLARAGLVTIDATSPARTVRIHALVQAVVLQHLAAAEFQEAARAAADALDEAWPRRDVPPGLEQALRDCTARLRQRAGRLLWAPECHPVLLRAGQSLESSALTGSAADYWHSMLGDSHEFLGAGHSQTVLARDRLARAYEEAGRTGDAIALHEHALAERERALSPGHPDTLGTQASLARAYRAAGRSQDALRLGERALSAAEQAMGPRHPDTLTACNDLAETYLSAGMTSEAIGAFQHTLAGREQVLGPEHPATAAARASLADAYRAAGRPGEALPLYQQALADGERAHGPDHPDTIAARAGLAAAYRAAGRLKDAIPVYVRTLADRSRVLGPDHPDTIASRARLADVYCATNRYKEAIPLYEQALAAREHALGPQHPATIATRGNLASAYHSAGKLAQAIPLYKLALAQCETAQGPDHLDSLTLRSNLAQAYHMAGRMTEALAIFSRTLADCERTLGPDHPMTQAARENLRAVSPRR